MESPAPAIAPRSTADLAEYLVGVGEVLMSHGCPTHRLEALVRAIAEMEGCAAEAFAVPTGLWLSLRAPGEKEPAIRMARVDEWDVDLEKLTLVDGVLNDLIARKLSFADARTRLDEIQAAPPIYSPALVHLATAATTATVALFFRGGLREALVAGAGGALLGGLIRLLGQSPRARLLRDFLGGLVAGAIAWGATAIAPDMSREVLVLSVVILLVPGMALTTGLAELAHRNLVSGAAKLMEAMMAFLSILFGIATVVGIERLFPALPLTHVALVPPPWPLQLAALLVAAFGFAILLSVPRRFVPAAMGACAVAFIVVEIGTRYLPGSLPAFAAALSVSLYANALARATSRPAQLFLLPGLILLVPGSFGFLSLEAFLRGEYVGGASKGFEMFLVAGALVTGLLVANVVLPARKVL